MILGIYGSGGLGQEVLELAKLINVKNRWEDIVFIDDINEGKCNDLERYSFEAFVDKFDCANTEIVIGIGEPALRELFYEKIVARNFPLATLIHPNVVIPENTSIGKGVVVNLGAFISVNIKIEDNVFIQHYVVIGHDCIIKRHANISAFVAISGHCCIGESTFIGMHVPVKEKITIGDNVIVGLGSCVLKNISDDVIALGSPARAIRRNEDRRVFKND